MIPREVPCSHSNLAYFSFSHGQKGPEGALGKDGDYNHLQIERASIRDDEMHC